MSASAPAANQADPCPDSFGCWHFDTANGGLPFTTAVTVQQSTNTAAYTLESDEATRHACIGPNNTVVYGGRSAWYTFDSAVDGTVEIRTQTSYEAMIVTFPQGAQPDPVRPNNLNSSGCSAHTLSPSLTQADDPGAVIHGQHYNIQVLGYCTTVAGGSPDPCPPPAGGAPAAGDLTITVIFTPNDRDGDKVPDTVDACPDVAGILANGCPAPPPAGPATTTPGSTTTTAGDYDHDGVSDSSDACPKLAGTLADGCPADDPDGDGVPTARDRCPSVHGTTAVGCNVTVSDSDGDGVPNATDTCPTTLGTLRNGCPVLPRLRVASDIERAEKAGIVVGVSDISVGRVPGGSLVRILCSGRRCFPAYRKLVKRARTVVYTPAHRFAFVGEWRVTVLVTKPGTAGYSHLLRIRRGETNAKFVQENPRDTHIACAKVESTHPVACAS